MGPGAKSQAPSSSDAPSPEILQLSQTKPAAWDQAHESKEILV